MGFECCLIEFKGDLSEILVLRTGADEDLIIAGLYTHGVGLWLQRDARTGAVDEDDLFASLFQGLEEVALHLGQFDMGAVATLETVDVDRHLLTFEGCRDTTHEDHLVDALELGDDLLIVDGTLLGDIDLQVGIPRLHKLEPYLDIITLSLLGLGRQQKLSSARAIVSRAGPKTESNRRQKILFNTIP